MDTLHTSMQLRSKFYIFFLAFAITSGSFVMGHALVATALLERQIQLHNSISQQHIGYYLSIIITLLPFGALLGSLTSAKMVFVFGQKNSMIAVDVLMAIALILQATSLDLYVLYVTRFIFGLFCGISSAIIPPYLTSISPLSMTGIIGCFNQLLITMGISAAYAMNFFLQSGIMDKESSIKIFILVPLPFCLIRLLVLSLQFPYDTVQRHFERQQLQKVKDIMNKIYIDASYQQFCRVKNFNTQNKQISSSRQASDKPSSIQQMNQKENYEMEGKIQINRPNHGSKTFGKQRIIMLSIVIAVANQLCGINAIMFYAKQLFSTLTDNDQELVKSYLLGLGVFQVVITFFSSLVLDRFGRRFLMLLGQMIVVFSLFGAFLATDIFHLSSNVVVFFVFLHIFGFSISLGPIGCLYASEIMQDISIVITLIWSLTLVVSLISDMMINSIGIGKTFLLFGVISLCCLIYFYRQMIESKGLSRGELQMRFNKKRTCQVRLQSSQEFQQLEEIVESQR